VRGLGDGTEMPHSLEGRVPYLDHDLFSFAWSIPSNLKLKNGETKWILRQALKEKLPNKIVKRPKHPLLAPPMIFDRNSLNSVTEILLSTGSTLFNQSTMESWLKEIDPENEQNTKSIDPIIHMLLSLSFLEKNYKLNF